MNSIKRAWNYLPVGVRGPVAVIILAGVVALAGVYSHRFDLYGPLALWPADFLRGQVWRALTYAWLPAGPADLIFNGFLVAILGTRLVAGLGRREFRLFCLVGLLGTAIFKLVLSPLSQGPMVGMAGVVFAMFAAWCRLFPTEEVMLMATWRMSMRSAILIVAGLIIMFGLLSSCGFWNAVAILGGGATGWLYLAAQSRWRMHHGPRVVPSERIRRLEL
ncbi:MAG TPA: rhomboid family intramembrane serine protease [Verrucomicrobiae bacterium]|nr:rhomboid family intramembrane serine protease [Verrucomicrobiae bacterium]